MKNSYERLTNEPDSELPMDVRRQVIIDFKKTTDRVNALEAASTPEARAELLKEYREYLGDQTLEYLHKLK
jgi:vacuolar-type H+-ATPase subunit D/Vma8